MAVLAEAMKEKRWNDAALAKELNISRVHASRLRRRICLPSPDLAKRLAELTGVAAEQFIFEDRAA